MLKNLGRLSLAFVLAASTLTVATTAEARGYYRDRGDDAAIAIGAGIVGIAIGAAIADDNDDRYYYRDRGYYRSYPDRYYYQDRRYYRPHYDYRYRNHYRQRDYREYRRDRYDGYDRGRYYRDRRWHR